MIVGKLSIVAINRFSGFLNLYFPARVNNGLGRAKRNTALEDQIKLIDKPNSIYAVRREHFKFGQPSIKWKAYLTAVFANYMCG